MASPDLWWVYLLSRSDDRFYVGMSRDPGQRLRQHQRGKGARFTHGQPDARLVGAVPIGTRTEAGRFERQAKRWRTERKLVFFGAYAQAWARHERNSAASDMSALHQALVQQDEAQRQLVDARHAVLNSLTAVAPELFACLRATGLNEHACCEWLCFPNEELGRSPAAAVAAQGSDPVLAWILRTIHGIAADFAVTPVSGSEAAPFAGTKGEGPKTDATKVGMESRHE